ncbi:MAG TPA: GIY-YIG nuclease family protein [Candidatus Acidoferrales bacterium]|nr:GIY-YIG nuclease family protein [Candidatus Acidoferrales bacterium]
MSEGVYVYVLRSLHSQRQYIGITKDLESRLREHNSGRTRATKAGAPWEIVRSEEYPDRTGAAQRERFLKSGTGRQQLRALLAGRRGTCPP